MFPVCPGPGRREHPPVEFLRDALEGAAERTTRASRELNPPGRTTSRSKPPPPSASTGRTLSVLGDDWLFRRAVVGGTGTPHGPTVVARVPSLHTIKASLAGGDVKPPAHHDRL